MKKRIPIIVLLLAAVAAGVYWFEVRPARQNRPTEELFGNVDIREVSLGFRVAGRLQQVLKEEGDAVAAGETIARLDDEPFRRELAEARAQVASLRSRVQLLEAGYRPQEIAQARAVVGERQVTMANALTLYKRQQELSATGAISAQERDDAEAKYRESDARLKSAREQLAVLEAGFRPEEVSQAKADLARVEAAVASVELRIEDATLKAPSGGVVLTRAQEPGAILPVGTSVMTVSVKRPVWVRAYIAEPDLGRIHPGMKVRVYTDSRKDRPYAGQVGYISPRAEFTPKSVETTELRTSLVYRLRVVIDEPDEGLRQGMPVTVRLNAN
jgi:HlyD family secretion protein